MAGGALAGPSRTAVVSAIGRAVHADGPPPHVLCDGLAGALAGSDGVSIRRELEARLSEAQLASISRWTSARARFVEDLVDAAVSDGVDQYVILGAGLDSFAYRRLDLLDRLRVFEVDHPATQAWKRRRLTELGIRIPGNVVFIPVDFERQSFVKRLADGGFDLVRRSMVSWIGVSMYLTLEAVEETLTALSGLAPGTRVAMTYDLPARALSGLQLDVRNMLAAIVSDLGEPFVTTFQDTEIESLLRRLGFDDLVHFGPADAVRLYFEDRKDLPVGGSQRLLTASVPPRSSTSE